MEELEQAFAEHSSQHPEQAAPPKRRTREEIIRDLKQKRAQEGGQIPKAVEVVKLPEDMKQKGKFKPIGFKPINASSAGKRRKGDGDSVKKKKRKVDEVVEQISKDQSSAPGVESVFPVPAPENGKPSKPSGFEDIDEDFDIFAGAGEYTGVEIDDDDGENDENRSETYVGHDRAELLPSTLPQRRWIAMDDELERLPPAKLIQPLQSTPPTDSRPDEAQETVERPMRLAPLESSAIPSIKDLLDMDDAANKHDRKQKRKEKKSRKRGKEVESDGD